MGLVLGGALGNLTDRIIRGSGLDGRVVDNSRLKKAFGFTPGFTTRAALEDFIRGRRIQQVLPRETVEQWERDLYAFLRRRGNQQVEEART